MPESPMKDNRLGIAARYNDADVEEHGFAAVFDRLGLKMDDVIYLAEQRAMRVLWVELGRDMSIFKESRPQEIPLTREQRQRLVILQAAVLDGILIGWRAKDIT